MKTMINPALLAPGILLAALIIMGGDDPAGNETKVAVVSESGERNLVRGHPSPPAVGAEKRDIVITRLFDAPVEVVWKAWTDPEYVMRWWGPTGFTACDCTIDFRVGGRFVFCMRAPKEMGGQDLYTSGVYRKIVPLMLIEFTQGLSDKGGNRIDPASIGMPKDFPSEIPSTLAFKGVGNKTELTATEYGWEAGQMRDMSELGLNQCLDKLAQALAKHK